RVEELDRRAPGLGRLITATLSSGVARERFEIRLPAARGGGILGARTTVMERKEAPWVTAVFQDITQSKRVEELRGRAERMEALAQLGASLAHEIKNPLSSIRSATEQLATESVAADDRAVLRGLVLRESDRLSRLLTEFMEFSRVEVQRRERVDLAGLALHAIEVVSQHADARGRRFEFEPPAGGLVVEGDEDLLHRALFNLLLNAVQYAGHEGMVRVEVGRIEETELPSGLRLVEPVRIAVTDSGPGIPAEDLPHVFDPFFTRRKGGTGLGLALVQRAVQAHNGAIMVEPGPAGGARFQVFLPSLATAPALAEARV
ncbi:MAG TPA: ATP-binding protein, partial [Longimicrobiales bacterium]